MIQKEKYNAKKILALILSLACVIGMLAGCARQNTGEGKAEGSSSEEPSSDTWYEVDQEAGILTVRLPAEKEGFIWDFTIDDTTLLELVTQEDDDGTFVASFRALGDGETVVSFSYARDDALEEIRALNVTCKDGKVADVSNASEEPSSDTWYEVDQEAGILTVRLPAEKEGFIWDFTIDDTTLLELLTQEDNDGTFVASFRALGDGETVVSFSYARDDALEEIRALNVTCKDGKVADVSNASEEPSSDTWYEVDQEAGILTVRLPAEKEGFIWNFTIDDTTLLELLTQEDNDGTFVASFRALGDGETVVSFSYARDDALEEIRALNVTCKDGKVADVSNASEEPSADTWYEVDQEAGILTVRLPAEKEGFIWNFTIDDTTLLELLTQEDDDGTFVASFRALGDGETVVSFSYARDDALEEIRALNVTCKDGKVADVSNASVMPISGQDDPEITDLRNSNSIPMIMKEHSAVTCVSETWDGENNWQNKTVRQFVSSDGRLWYDYEQYDDADQVVYCEAGYINDNLPGALYTCEKDGLKTMTLCPASEYEAMVSGRWLARQPYDYETVADKTDSTEYGTTTLTAARQNGLTGINSEVIYFIDDATGLITGMEVTEHSAEDGSVVSVTRSNILYDEPRLMEEQAAMNILFPEDACYLNVIINPGKENSEEQAFQMDKSTEVEFDAMEGYQLYYDYDCTQPMDWIDVGQNKLTVYVTIDSAK